MRRNALALATALMLCGCPGVPVLIEAADGGDEDAGVDIDAGVEEAIVNICGDGVVGGIEQCDDGNQAIDDDCTPSCRVIAAVCGDGRVGIGEQCDDGNRDNADTCSNTCVSAVDHADAGTGPSLTDECPVLRSFVITPYAGDDDRLVGHYFTFEAMFDVEPEFAQWIWTPLDGQLFLNRGQPYRVGYSCNTTGDRVIGLLTAQPNCAAVSHLAMVTCEQPYQRPH